MFKCIISLLWDSCTSPQLTIASNHTHTLPLSRTKRIPATTRKVGDGGEPTDNLHFRHQIDVATMKTRQQMKVMRFSSDQEREGESAKGGEKESEHCTKGTQSMDTVVLTIKIERSEENQPTGSCGKQPPPSAGGLQTAVQEKESEGWDASSGNTTGDSFPGLLNL